MKNLLKLNQFITQGRQWFSPLAAAHARIDPKVIPQWHRDAILDPDRYSIDCAGYDLSGGPEANPELINRMRRCFDDVGLALIRNTGLDPDVAEMGKWCHHLIGNEKYEGGANSRGEIAKSVYEVGAPFAAYLQYHHEMSYVYQSIKYLGFCAAKVIEPTEAEPFRGMTFLSENVGVTNDLLKTPFGQKLKDKGICYIRCLTDEEVGTTPQVYNHWQTSFGTTDPKEAERRCLQKGLKFAWGPDRYLRTKCYISGFEYFPHLDRNVLYSSIADHGNWFDTWPGVAELPDIESFETATPDHKPLKITFGDDTPMTRAEIELFAEVYDQNGFPLDWRGGDIAIVCNYRFAHGRPEFKLEEGEERTLGVVLGGMYNRVGQVEGKW